MQIHFIREKVLPVAVSFSKSALTSWPMGSRDVLLKRVVWLRCVRSTLPVGVSDFERGRRTHDTFHPALTLNDKELDEDNRKVLSREDQGLIPLIN